MSFDIIDYQELASSRYTDLFKDDAIFDATVKSLISPLQSYQIFLKDFHDNFLSIDNSFGQQLDIIGGLVGQPRVLLNFLTDPYFGFLGAANAEVFGTEANAGVGGYWRSILNPKSGTAKTLDDETYRKLIKARIIKNRSNGSVNDFLLVMNILSGNTLTRVDVSSNSGTGLVTLVYPVDPLANYYLGKIRERESLIPVPLGVRLNASVVYPDGIDVIREAWDYKWYPKPVADSLGDSGKAVNIDLTGWTIGQEKIEVPFVSGTPNFPIEADYLGTLYPTTMWYRYNFEPIRSRYMIVDFSSLFPIDLWFNGAVIGSSSGGTGSIVVDPSQLLLNSHNVVSARTTGGTIDVAEAYAYSAPLNLPDTSVTLPPPYPLNEYIANTKVDSLTLGTAWAHNVVNHAVIGSSGSDAVYSPADNVTGVDSEGRPFIYQIMARSALGGTTYFLLVDRYLQAPEDGTPNVVTLNISFVDTPPYTTLSTTSGDDIVTTDGSFITIV